MKLLSITHIPIPAGIIEGLDGVIYIENYKTFTSYSFKRTGYAFSEVLDYRVSCRVNYTLQDFIKELPNLLSCPVSMRGKYYQK